MHKQARGGALQLSKSGGWRLRRWLMWLLPLAVVINYAVFGARAPLVPVMRVRLNETERQGGGLKLLGGVDKMALESRERWREILERKGTIGLGLGGWDGGETEGGVESRKRMGLSESFEEGEDEEEESLEGAQLDQVGMRETESKARESLVEGSTSKEGWGASAGDAQIGFQQQGDGFEPLIDEALKRESSSEAGKKDSSDSLGQDTVAKADALGKGETDIEQHSESLAEQGSLESSIGQRHTSKLQSDVTLGSLDDVISTQRGPFNAQDDVSRGRQGSSDTGSDVTKRQQASLDVQHDAIMREHDIVMREQGAAQSNDVVSGRQQGIVEAQGQMKPLQLSNTETDSPRSPPPPGKPKKYLYFSDTIDDGQTGGLIHQVNGLACALQESRYLRRWFVLPTRFRLDDHHRWLPRGFPPEKSVNPWGPEGPHDDALRWTSITTLFDLAEMHKSSRFVLADDPAWLAARAKAEAEKSVVVINGWADRDLMKRRENKTAPVLIHKASEFWFTNCLRYEPPRVAEHKWEWHHIVFAAPLRGAAQHMMHVMGGNGSYSTLHIRRGDKLTYISHKTKQQVWPNLDNETRPDFIAKKISQWVPKNESLYIASNEPELGFFDPLRDKYGFKIWTYHDFLYALDLCVDNDYQLFAVEMEVVKHARLKIATFKEDSPLHYLSSHARWPAGQ